MERLISVNRGLIKSAWVELGVLKARYEEVMAGAKAVGVGTEDIWGKRVEEIEELRRRLADAMSTAEGMTERAQSS